MILNKFKKLVLYDFRRDPLDATFIKSLDSFATEVEIILAEGEFQNGIKKTDLIGADAFISRVFEHYPQGFFNETLLRYIGLTHTDVSDLNLNELKAKNITLTHVPAYSTQSVAELTIGALICIMRRIPEALNYVRAGNWGFEPFLGSELFGKTLGIVGLGAIGSKVAHLAQAFGMEVLYYSRTRRRDQESLGISFVQFSELLERSHVISFHCPLTEETRAMLTSERVQQLKSSTILLNPSRPEIFDLAALYKRCATSDLFVWFDELQNQEWRDKFRNMDNVYLTPDFGWWTKEAQKRNRDWTLDNIKAYLAGKPQNTV
ncbi:MAG: 2-hydroxyacid dehydrogenase [Bdellovibrionota bacterium]|jgi:glycerate dehydrogenase